jgi:hypothetical protein
MESLRYFVYTRIQKDIRQPSWITTREYVDMSNVYGPARKSVDMSVMNEIFIWHYGRITGSQK